MTGPTYRPDNQPGRPPRPTDVPPDGLEQALRESLSRQVALPARVTADPAGAAIRRANGIQRRRTVAGLGLAAVATVLVSTGMAQLAEPPARYHGPSVVFGDPAPLASPAPVPTGRSVDQPPVDLVVGTTLVTTGGATVDLAAIGPVERALRTADGVLMIGAPTVAGRTLWFVGVDGAERAVLAGVEQVVFSADGRQVAWREGNELRVAGIINGKVIATVRSSLTEPAVPERFVGDQVLVRRTTVGGAAGGYALWRPAAGPFRPQWRATVLAVHGTLPDGRLFGQVEATAGGARCLALLDPAAGLAPVQTGCGYALSADGHGTVSPDGRWLVVNGRPGRTSGGAEAALLIEVSRAFGPTPAARPAGPRLLGAARWVDPSTLVHVDEEQKLVRLGAVEAPAGGASGEVPTVRTEIPDRKPDERMIVVGAAEGAGGATTPGSSSSPTGG